MKLPRFFAFFLFLGAAQPVLACMNTYRPEPAVNRKALQHSESIERRIFENDGGDDWPDRVKRLQSELNRGGDFRVKNDLAVALAHMGQAAQAVKLLEEIE